MRYLLALFFALCVRNVNAEVAPIQAGAAISSNDGKTLQTVSSTTANYFPAQGTAIPKDDTAPTTAEGWKVLVATITPVDAGSTLWISGELHIYTASCNEMTMAFFKNATAIYASSEWLTASANNTNSATFRFPVSAEDVTERNYSVRIGCSDGTSASLGLNGNGAGRLYGGLYVSRLDVTEIAPAP
jgi:hypothetical protein